MTTNNTDVSSGPYSLANHKITVTIFPDNLARTKQEAQLTLVQLATLIHGTKAKKKDRLPLIKLASFGNVASMKGCLRTNDNMLMLYGIEVEHDAGTMSMDEAIELLRRAQLRAIVYTTPSHTPEAPRWRVLLPYCYPVKGTEQRRRMVERVNHVLLGALAHESLNVSQAYYFGQIEGSTTFSIEWLDGDFIDLADDIAELPLSGGHAGRPHVTVFAELSIIQLNEHMMKWVKDNTLAWHDPMLHLTAKLAAAGGSEEDIIAACAPYCYGGDGDREMLDMVASAIRKFGRPVDPAMAQLNFTPEQQRDEPITSTDRPGLTDNLFAKGAWLIEHYGYYPAEDRVIDLYATSADCRLRPAAFVNKYADWSELRKAGGKHRDHATGYWTLSPQRKRLSGVRMAPDRAFPLFEDNGQLYKNTYQRPAHEGAGEADTFWTFLEHLLPVEEERSWFMKQMAHKWVHPEEPGSAIMMVADGVFGAGRGILFSIARLLYGPGYVREQEFANIVGSRDGARFNSWMADCVLAVCNEARSSPTGYRRAERKADYECFKSFFDPASRTRTIEGKGINSFESKIHMSLWMATNHVDPFVIHAEDRRLTVLSNGGKMSHELIDRMLAWRAVPGNITQLARELEKVDLTGFRAQVALMTQAKQNMIDEGKTAVDEAFEDMSEDDALGLVFTRAELFRVVCGRGGEANSSGHFEAAWREYVCSVSTDGTHAGHRRIRIAGKPEKLFCFKRRAAEAAKLGSDQLRPELDKWMQVGNH